MTFKWQGPRCRHLFRWQRTVCYSVPLKESAFQPAVNVFTFCSLDIVFVRRKVLCVSDQVSLRIIAKASWRLRVDGCKASRASFRSSSASFFGEGVLLRVSHALYSIPAASKVSYTLWLWGWNIFLLTTAGLHCSISSVKHSHFSFVGLLVLMFEGQSRKHLKCKAFNFH